MSGRRLREAADRGDLRGVQAEIAKGVNVNETGKVCTSESSAVHHRLICRAPASTS